jgi:riboflavin synthase
MFTGIVAAVGRVARIERRGTGARVVIDAGALDLSDVAIGDSIAVAGVCLTALDPAARTFAADVSAETLARTTLGLLAEGDGVNLEKSLRLADRLGGHLVSGHVDGLGRVASIDDEGGAQRWTFALPRELARYVAVKGSIGVDGTSLTVNAVDDASFGVTLIPHTLAVTTFGARKTGDAVNIEVDMIARYAERLMHAER